MLVAPVLASRGAGKYLNSGGRHVGITRGGENNRSFLFSGPLSLACTRRVSPVTITVTLECRPLFGRGRSNTAVRHRLSVRSVYSRDAGEAARRGGGR